VQRVDQTESALDTHCSDESSISVTGTSRQTRGPAAALVSSFPDLDNPEAFSGLNDIVCQAVAVR
jgi:hypothetical protein